jgi:hypothetical protein
MQRKNHFEFFNLVNEKPRHAYRLSDEDIIDLAQAIYLGNLKQIKTKFNFFSKEQKQAFFNVWINYNNLYKNENALAQDSSLSLTEKFPQGYPLDLAEKLGHKELKSYFKRQMQNLPAYVTHFFNEEKDGKIETRKWSYWKREFFISTQDLVINNEDSEDKQTYNYKK